MSDTERATLSGQLPADLCNALSDAINAALRRGMETDEAVCCAAAVIADYARGAYGNAYLVHLAGVIVKRAGCPLPEDAAHV